MTQPLRNARAFQNTNLIGQWNTRVTHELDHDDGEAKLGVDGLKPIIKTNHLRHPSAIRPFDWSLGGQSLTLFRDDWIDRGDALKVLFST